MKRVYYLSVVFFFVKSCVHLHGLIWLCNIVFSYGSFIWWLWSEQVCKCAVPSFCCRQVPSILITMCRHTVLILSKKRIFAPLRICERTHTLHIHTMYMNLIIKLFNQILILENQYQILTKIDIFFFHKVLILKLIFELIYFKF